ncbi:MAG: hypothetical protein ACFCVD_23815 [Nodosilinea sp.]
MIELNQASSCQCLWFKRPLFYGGVKIDAEDRYHVIPRTRPSQA